MWVQDASEYAHRPIAPQPPLPHALQHGMSDVHLVNDAHACLAALLPVQAAMPRWRYPSMGSPWEVRANKPHSQPLTPTPLDPAHTAIGRHPRDS